jgi:DNA adenine methylase
MYEPAVKWSGSKRSQAEEIIKLFPKEINTYYEPFCGGCSVLRRLLSSDIKVNRYVCSDLNGDLINLWNMIKDNPKYLSDYYSKLWSELNVDDDKERKKRYFESVRERYNKEHKAEDFLFIMRTTTNGMPRYNKDGKFNNSFHVTRNGILPDKLEKILLEWSELLNKYNVEFKCCSYEEISTNENDLLYLDPPYAATRGMYYGTLDFEVFFDWLRQQNGYYLLSFDGKSGNIDNTYNVPEDLYSEHKYMFSGNSSFKRTIGKSNDSIVYESLYLK